MRGREAAPAEVRPSLWAESQHRADRLGDGRRVTGLEHRPERPGRIAHHDAAHGREVAEGHRDAGGEALEQLVRRT